MILKISGGAIAWLPTPDCGPDRLQFNNSRTASCQVTVQKNWPNTPGIIPPNRLLRKHQQKSKATESSKHKQEDLVESKQ